MFILLTSFTIYLLCVHLRLSCSQTILLLHHAGVTFHLWRTRICYLFQMSAITVGCMQTYKGSVDKTLDEVDANIKVRISFYQGIIDMYRNGNFCTGTWVSKVIAKTKVGARVEQHKKFTGFSRMSVMANLLCFGCFTAG